MIQIELIETLPDLNWSEQALFEMKVHGVGELNRSAQIFQLGNAGVAGYTYPSLVAPPWLWFMLSKKATLADIKHIRRASDLRLPKGTRTCVQAGYAVGERFAKFFGFEPTGDCFTLNGLSYNIFRRD